MVLWRYSPLIYSQTSNWKSNSEIYKCKFIKQVVAVSLLFDLGAARQGRSVLFLDKQKLLFEGGKKGFAKNTKLDFMSC
jgi:hypothetical protein